MNFLNRLELWGDSHHPKWLDFLRIALGIFLCYKGIAFLYNMSAMMNLMSTSVSFGSFALMLIGHYVVFAHVIGGFFLALGILTRFACIIQIPILLGAIFFINTTDLFQPFSELLVSILVLLLLILFLIVGNGPLSFRLFTEEEK